MTYRAEVLVDRPLELEEGLPGQDLGSIARPVADNRGQLEALAPLAAEAAHFSFMLPFGILLAKAPEHLHQNHERTRASQASAKAREVAHTYEYQQSAMYPSPFRWMLGPSRYINHDDESSPTQREVPA